MAHNNKRSAARQAVETLERPEGVSAPTWRGVVALLKCIAEHYPNPYPSQERLAALTGYSVRSIQTYVAVAKEHGLLLVKADAGKKGRNNTWSRTNRYLIVNPQTLPHPLTQELRANPTGTTYPPGEELRSSHSSSEKSLSVVRVSRQEEPSRQVGPAAKAPRSKAPARRPVASDLVVDGGRRAPNVPRPPKSVPWRRTAGRFMTRWDEMITNTPRTDALRSVRPADTLGHFQQYLNAHFYGKDALTPKSEDEVEVLIANFVADVARRQIRIKDGQSAWMAFTGAWGRNTTRTAHSSAAAVDEYFKDKP